MRWLAVLGLALQLTGTWFLCRVFFRLSPLVRGQSTPWQEQLANTRWSWLLSRIGKHIFLAPKLPGAERARVDEVLGNPNVTFAFLLILAGAACQGTAALCSR